MIDNTTKAIEKIMGQLKSMDIIRKLMTMLIYIAYILYRIIASTGYLALNITLLTITVLYLSFYVCYISMQKGTFTPKAVSTINRIYRWTKLVFAGIGVGLNVAAFLSLSGEQSAITTIFAICLPVFFLLQLICDVIFEYASYCFAVIKEGVTNDVENIKAAYEKPIRAVKSVKETVDGFNNFKEGIKGIAKSIFGKTTKADSDVAATDDESAPEQIEEPKNN